MRIQTLGGLRAFLGDSPLSLPPSRQSRALLACLACASRPLSRSGLCELLWENSPEPRAALRWCLSRLRPVLDSGGVTRLRAEADTLWLSPEDCEVDGKRLRELAVAAAEAGTPELEASVTRLAGGFLADLEFADAMRFESWRVAEERDLARARALLFEELLRRHRADPEAAVRAGHLWVQQDPFDPRPHIAILEALSALGRGREALAHYERCAQMLRNHGGGVPAALEKARAAIGRLGAGAGTGTGEPAPAQADRAARDAGPAPGSAAAGNFAVSQGADSAPAGFARTGPPDPRGGGTTPLAGREREMAAFGRILAAAADRPDARLHILSGEPGIGKTRLLEELGARLAAGGWLRLRGRAFEAERSRAFGPWIDAAWALAAERPEAMAGCPLLPSAQGELRAAEARLPGASGHSSPSGLAGLPGPAAVGEPAALFEAVRRWLSGLSETAPLALLFDDLHWLDASSVALLQYLMRSGGPFRLLFGSIRSVAAAPDAAVDAFLRLLRREGWAETWDVGPLSAEGTAELVRKLGSSRDPAEVFAAAAGHPLASLALAQEGGDGGRLRRESLAAMLDERIRLAGDEGRGLLQWAALMGRGLPPALLESLTDLSVHALLSALERLEAQGLVKVEEGKAGQEYLFGHDLIRQRVRDGLSEPRRKRMHAHAARVLKRMPALSRGAEETAQHAELGEEWALAAEACLEAGHQCIRLKAFEATAELARRALDLAWKVEGNWVLRQEICYLVNSVFNCLARFPEGMDASLLRLAREAKAAGQEEAVVAALTALTTLRYEQGRPADVLEAVREVAGTLGEAMEPGLRAFTLADMAMCLLVTDQELPRARRLFEEAVAVCEAYGVEDGFVEAVRGALHFRDGRLGAARESIVRALPRLAKAAYPGVLHLILAELARLELADGDPRASLRWAGRMRELEAEVRHKADVHFPDALEALARRDLGDPGAEALYRDALARLRARDTKVMTSYLLLSWSERDLAAGRLDAVEAACREAIERCAPLGRVTEPAWARSLLGLLALARGRRGEAEALEREVAAALGSPTPPPRHVVRLAEALRAALAAPAPA